MIWNGRVAILPHGLNKRAFIIPRMQLFSEETDSDGHNRQHRKIRSALHLFQTLPVMAVCHLIYPSRSAYASASA